MSSFRRAARRGAAAVMVLAAAACASGGSLGNVLGSVLGGGQTQGGQASGAIVGVDTRARQIVLQTQDGQQVSLAYDDQTRVVYQNQNYPVTSLERGDRVTVRVQDTGNGAYYTDLVQVDQSVSGTGGTGNTSANGALQSFQGTVRQVDATNGLFSVDVGGGTTLIVSLPYNVTRSDQDRFRSLRGGEYVRFVGTFLNSSRVELRQFN